MAAITPPLTNSSRLRTRKLLGPNLIWPLSCRNRMSPPEPGNRTTSACGFCGTPAIKYDWVTPGRVGSVTISCAEAPATETNNHTHASRFFDFDITRPTQDGSWPYSLLGRLASRRYIPCSLLFALCSLLRAVTLATLFFHRFVGYVDVHSQTILARPVGVLRHLELFLDLIQRFTLTRHLAHALEQQRVKAFIFVENFRGAHRTMTGHDDFRVQRFHQLVAGENVRDRNKRSEIDDAFHIRCGCGEK